MEGLYKVVDIDRSTGVLHLRAVGGRHFRVQLGAEALAGFSMGMKVKLRKSESGGLVLEATSPGRLAAAGSGQGAAVESSSRRDRRATPRTGFAGQTTVFAEARTIQCSAHDISQHGLGLRLPKYERLEGPLEIAFKLPNSHRLLKVKGVVARFSTTSSETIWGIGFEDVAQDASSALQAFVEAGATGQEPGEMRSKMDRSLANLYQDAVGGLVDD